MKHIIKKILLENDILKNIIDNNNFNNPITVDFLEKIEYEFFSREKHKIVEYLGSGSYNDAFRLSNGQVLKVIQYPEYDDYFYNFFAENPHPNVIPSEGASFFEYNDGEYSVALTEYATNIGDKSIDRQELINNIYKDTGIKLTDVHYGNVGYYKGNPVIIDADIN